MCYEYDWMQVPKQDEELRRAQERADLLKKLANTAPPTPTPEPARPQEQVPA